MNEDIQRIETKIDKHIEESVNVRDRLKTVELQTIALQKAVDAFPAEVMKNAIIGGIIGAMIGSGAAPAVTKLVQVVFGG